MKEVFNLVAVLMLIGGCLLIAVSLGVRGDDLLTFALGLALVWWGVLFARWFDNDKD